MLKITKASLGSIVLVTALVGALGACDGSDSKKTTDEALTTINVWDPYPQHDEKSDWAKYLQTCAPAGTTLVRTAAAQADLLNNLTSGVKAGNAPDLVMLDNPAVPDAATAGLLAPASDVGIDTAGYDKNLAGPGVIDGVAYGVPIGVNTLGLYYNKNVLDKAGVDPASITNWAGLNAALEKITKAGYKGITYSGIAGEEGVFQFLPWFWGAGASLKTPGSDQAAAAGQLVSDWIGKGYAPKSAITDNQAASWQLFLSGKYAFAENGSWFAQSAAKLTDFKAVAMALPGKDSGAAPVPTGAEFIAAPMQKNNTKAHYANATKVVACLLGKDNQVKTAPRSGTSRPARTCAPSRSRPTRIWQPWAAAIDAAQGRTSDLGPKYTATSAAISTALQAAQNAAGDAAKVKDAFTKAGQG